MTEGADDSEHVADLSSKGSDDSDTTPEKWVTSGPKNNLGGEIAEEDAGIKVGTLLQTFPPAPMGERDHLLMCMHTLLWSHTFWK